MQNITVSTRTVPNATAATESVASAPAEKRSNRTVLCYSPTVAVTSDKQHLPFAALSCIDGPGVSEENRCADVGTDFGVGKWDGDVVLSDVSIGEAVECSTGVTEED